MQLLNTSNPADARITGNVVEFIFENIQLGGPGGHGHILLKIKSKNTLVAGDAVAKNANIYFDYNAPVDTGMVTTVSKVCQILCLKKMIQLMFHQIQPIQKSISIAITMSKK